MGLLMALSHRQSARGIETAEVVQVQNRDRPTVKLGYQPVAETADGHGRPVPGQAQARLAVLLILNLEIRPLHEFDTDTGPFARLSGLKLCFSPDVND